MGSHFTMASHLSLLLALTALAALAHGASVPEGALEEEHLAFAICEEDGQAGLTWPEVADCEDRWVNVPAAQLASNEQLNMPSMEDFDASDLNQDGTLLFDEWTQWVAIQ